MNNSRIVTGIFLILLFSCSTDTDNDLKEMNLKGNVRSLEIVGYKAVEKFGEISEGEMVWLDTDKNAIFNIGDYFTFNSKGFIIEESSFSPYSGDITSKVIYSHDNKGLKIKGRLFNFHLQPDTLLGVFEFVYDKKNKLSEVNTYEPDGEFSEKGIFHYDEKGRVTEQNIYDIDGSINWSIKRKYNDNINREEVSWYDEYGDLHSRTISMFDENKNLIAKTEINSRGEKTTTNYTYDELDRRGNWIRRVEYQDDEPKRVVRRIIGYGQERKKEFFGEPEW